MTTDTVEGWLDMYRAAGASPETIRCRRSYVRTMLAAIDPTTAEPDDVVRYLAGRRGLSAEARKSMCISLRSYFLWCWTRDLTEHDLSKCLPAVHVPAGLPRPIPDVNLRKALHEADEETRLMLLLGCYAGLRRAEIAGVHSDHVAGMTLIVTGKGGRTRRVPIHPMLAGRLARVRGWAFPSPVRAGQHVTGDYIADRLSKVLPAPYTAHSLRHYFATMAYRGTHDLRAVQQLLGHARPETTARYTLVDEDALTAAVLAVA